MTNVERYRTLTDLPGNVTRRRIGVDRRSEFRLRGLRHGSVGVGVRSRLNEKTKIDVKYNVPRYENLRAWGIGVLRGLNPNNWWRQGSCPPSPRVSLWSVANSETLVEEETRDINL